jgi:FAD/FMN-containing dehydrogenase/Fe-S oxidoreductase
MHATTEHQESSFPRTSGWAAGDARRGQHSRVGDPRLAARLAREIEGDVLFDKCSRGRYSTDASIYQIEPVGVVVPKTWQDVVSTMQIAAEEGVSILPRGGGTSQCGQTVAEAIVIDVSVHLRRLVDIDVSARYAVVEPGIVLDHLNGLLAASNLMFPVDVSTASRATLGGMAGNNSCGARSIRYGTMRDNVQAIDAIMINGERMTFGPLAGANDQSPLVRSLLALGQREAQEIRQRFPLLQCRVGGYNIDALISDKRERDVNLAQILVGSEGTLAFSERIHLNLHPLPPHKVLGVCHFPNFYAAMDMTQHLVKLGPSAVELVDRTMIDLAREIPMFRATVDRCVEGEPEALLLVEFSGDDSRAVLDGLKDLVQCMGDLGFPDAVVEAVDPGFQKAIWEVRKAGLNIMMSMKGDGKPVSFVEDCAVRLEDLAEYTDRLTEVFRKYGTTGTWYAHASVGCLHVRPVLNLKLETDTKNMRAIAEEAFAMVREYKGSHSGEHGDGLVRSEFHKSMFGSRMVENFAEVKKLFDPKGLMNPGKIVNPSRMDDRSLFRYKPGYRTKSPDSALDWSEWGGFAGAVEMCNNNGACRKFDAGVMCPSYRVTNAEQHLTRGRANTLRLALSGQLDHDAFTSAEMYDTMRLCVSCKGCKRECPTGVDMAKMKIEFLRHYHLRHGLGMRERLIANLPRYAPWVSRMHGLANLRNRSRILARLGDRFLGLSAKRSLPKWHSRPFLKDASEPAGGSKTGELVLFADTFNRYFEPQNLTAALEVLHAAGYQIHMPGAADGSTRPLCCGRTFLAAGLVDEAITEARRTLAALKPFIDRDIPVVGLEPSCLLTFRDEFASMLTGQEVDRLAANAKLFEEFLAEQRSGGLLELNLGASGSQNVAVHGHCHQKAFDAMGAVTEVLKFIPGMQVEIIQSSCCGMAGSFGYNADTYDVSVKMAALNLLPAVRELDSNTRIVADGTSCRHQIADLSGRDATHVACILRDALIR